MTSPSPALKPEALLSQLDWLRSLARSLVLDTNLAEDLVQDALVTALQSPPADEGALRPWLRTVARRLAFRGYRGRERRARREIRAFLDHPRTEAESVEEVEERAELQKCLVNAVLALREPYRRTVILRYFEGMTAAEIGRRLEVEGGAVRMRLARAHAMLQKALDADYGGDRRVWSVGLLLLARDRGLPGSPLGEAGRVGGEPAVASAQGLLQWLSPFLGARTPYAIAAAALFVAVTVLVVQLIESRQDPASPADRRETARRAAAPGVAAETGADRGPALAAVTSGSRVSGFVRDAETGDPLSGAVIRLSIADGVAQTVTSREDGSFEIREVPEGDHLLSLADGPILAAGEPLAVAARGADMTGLELLGVPGGVVSGRVVDAWTGEPLAGVEVRALRGSSERTERVSGPTDVDGRFALLGLTEGIYHLSPDPIDGYPQLGLTERIRVFSGPRQITDGVTIEVPSGVRVRGRVEDVNGDPVAGASVMCVPRRAGGVEVVSGEDGSFAATVHRSDPPGVFLSASRGGQASRISGPIGPDADGTVETTLVLEPCGAVRGRLEDGEGRGAPGASVRLYSNEGTNRSYHAVAGDSGDYEIGDVAPGSYLLGKHRIEVSPGEVVSAPVSIVSLSESLAITGRVTDGDGNPLARGWVEAVGVGVRSTSVTDDDGTYRLEVARGSYSVSATVSGYAREPRAEVLAGSQRIDFALQRCSQVSGRVIDATSGLPVHSFRVAAVRGDESESSDGVDGLLQVCSDRQGRFLIEAVEGPVATVRVRADGYILKRVTLRGLRPDEARDGVEVRLERFEPLTGVVLDGDGGIVEDAAVYDVGAASVVARSDGRGEFSLASLRSDRGALVIRHADHAPARLEYFAPAVSGQRLEITMTGWSRVAGTVTIGGAPAPGIAVAFFDRAVVSATTETDADGRYELRVPGGELQLRAEIPNPERLGVGRLQDRHVTVAEGESIVVDFSFSGAGAVIEGWVRHARLDLEKAQLAAIAADVAGGLEGMPSDADAEGRFRIDNAPVGAVHLLVQATFAGGKTFARTIPLVTREGETSRVELDFGAGGSLTVDLGGLDAGEGAIIMVFEGEVVIDELTMAAIQALVPRFAGQEIVDRNGERRFEGLVAGTYTILVIHGPNDGVQRGDMTGLQHVCETIELDGRNLKHGIVLP